MDSKYGKSDKQVYPEDRNMEFLKLDKKVYIPTCDKDGNTTWGEMTAVTRHDPGERLYKVKTLSGRNVTVAESKSLLIWDDYKKEFQGKFTPDVKIGDYVPVTVNLQEPPVLSEYFDMTEYFPKTEYIYGTEFNKATKYMTEAMIDRIKIPQGWWKTNNGKTFITPYTKKSSLTRMLSGRSNTENIKDGYIYPYHASRDSCLIPDKFELNKENGIFIGLYLAEGSSHDYSGKVSIANIDTDVKLFVKKWFDKHNITNKEYTKQMKIGITENIGTSTSIQGSSTILARFLDKFVGHGAHNKFVPSIAFTAPEEFIIGILNGYIAGDGSVGNSGITTTSASYKLTEGIAMLCSRLGIFGNMSIRKNKTKNLAYDKTYADSHVLTIRSKWAKIMSEKVDCVLVAKNTKLKQLSCSKKHINYPDHNNVVLDKITKIEIIDVSDNPKLYDVTVPSTENFQISNGINVYDTLISGVEKQ